MRVAVTAQAPGVTSLADPFFGRTKYFIVADTETGAFAVHNNSMYLGAVHAAGIQAAGAVIHWNVNAVITGNIGPNAFAVLRDHHVTVYRVTSGAVKDAIDKLRVGQLEAVTTANVEGHWGNAIK